MEQSTESGTRRTQARHHDARARAFAARRGEPAERYETPAWLDRSFVLPVTDADVLPADQVPSQPEAGHDDLDVSAHLWAQPEPVRAEPVIAEFVRPETPEIDFAEVVRRCDATRRARQAALTTLVMAMLAALAALVAPAAVVVPLAVVLTVVGASAALWCDGQTRAPVPLRD